MNLLDEKNWKSLCASQDVKESVPDWVRSLMDRPFGEIQALPLTTSAAHEGTIFKPSLETVELTDGYLEFLKCEIRVEARGKKWSDTLRTRLNALLPYEHQIVYQIVVSGHSKPARDGQMKTGHFESGIAHWA